MSERVINDKPRRTRFVISPIGPEGTTVRAEADDFLELLVEPALAKYSLDVVRGDRIAKPTVITSDIIKHVQESDLCIIDLTNNNPNVFYECGRRHENGRPFVQMISKEKEQDIPFDVAGIRTIVYDLSNPRNILESQKRLQQFIDNIMAAGLQPATSGESLSSVAQALDRIERKVNVLVSNSAARPGSEPVEPDVDDGSTDDDVFGEIVQPPRTRFIRAMRRGQIDRAAAVLPRLKVAVSQVEYVAAVALLASAGNAAAFEMLDGELRSVVDRDKLESSDEEMIQAVAEGANRYFGNTGDYKTGLKYLRDLAGKLSSLKTVSDATKAFVFNKVGMLSWSAEEYDLSRDSSLEAVRLAPDSPSYLYNLALSYEKDKDTEKLASTLERLKALPDLDSDHRRLLRRHGYGT